MKAPGAAELHISSTTLTGLHLTRWTTATANGTLILGAASGGQARKKGGKKKKVCKCALGYHCEKGKCVPDA